MKVSELIKQLSTLPDDMEVYGIPNADQFDSKNRFDLSYVKTETIRHNSCHSETVLVLEFNVL